MVTTFNKVTQGEVFLAYQNDKGHTVICRTDEVAEVIRLTTEEGAKVVPFDTLLSLYEVYKSFDEEAPSVSFSDWVIGEIE